MLTPRQSILPLVLMIISMGLADGDACTAQLIIALILTILAVIYTIAAVNSNNHVSK